MDRGRPEEEMTKPRPGEKPDAGMEYENGRPL